jgi:hypothetical protein
MRRRSSLFAAAWMMLGAVCCLRAQEAPAAAPAAKRYSFGLRFQAAGLRMFKTYGAETSTTSPIADYTYSAKSDLHRTAVLPALEIRVRDRMTVGVDLLFHHALYRATTEIRSGKKDANASTDDRAVTTITETSKANYWELPVLVRYYGIRKHGLLARAYVGGGGAFRHVGKIRTGTEYAYADATTDYNEAAAVPHLRNQFGAVAAVGLRFMDEVGLKVMPEIRFVHWQGQAFQGPSYRSTQNDASIGLGFVF